MNKIRTVFKVVLSDDFGHLVSWGGGKALRYELGVRTRAPRGSAGILVFVDLDDAKRFISHGFIYGRQSARILECDAHGEGIWVYRLLLLGPGSRGLSKRDRFSNKRFSREGIIRKILRMRYNETFSAPRGTLSVESVLPRARCHYINERQS